MRKVKIITDSCGDLNAAQLEQYNVDYVKMFTVEDGVESPALLTWSAEEAHVMYDKIRGGKRITTAQVSVEEFQTVFGKYLAEGYDIVYVACAAKLSGSLNTGILVAKKLLAEYPDAEISCIDSLNSTMGQALLVIRAATMAAEGKSCKEITDHIVAVRKTVQEYATVHTLEHLKKAGRVSAPSAFFGNLFGIKPILVQDVTGIQAAYKKVKGRQTSLREIVALLKENIVDAENQTVFVGHADCAKEEVDALVEMVKREIPCKDVFVGMIGPIVGASVGPDTVGVWAFGKPVTFCGAND